MAAIIPGPISFFAISLGVLKDYKLSLIGGLGNSLASTLQVIASYNLIFFSINIRNNILNISVFIGAVYMIYLAWNIYLHNPFIHKNTNKRNVVFITMKEVFFKSFFLTLSNPKAILFFLALFPQLIITSDNSNKTLVILISVIFIVALVSFFINSYIGNITKNILEQEIFAKFMGNSFSLFLLALSVYSFYSIFKEI
jgi:threonine/homoserine/homoserine lactone efflux protein